MSTRHLARLLSGLLLFALTTPLSAQSAEPFSELQVVERIAYDLELPRGNLMSFHLASDGQRILDASRDQICVYDLAGVELSCAERPDDVSFDPESVHWSPDGRFVALIDGLPLRTLRDSDLWVLDLETGEYRNLTDDNGRENLLAAFGSDLGADTVYSTIDLQPRFTPDGTLYFMRYEALNQVVAALLYRLELPDGAPEAIAVFTENTDSQGFPYLWDIAPNGQTAVFSSVSNGNEVLRRVEIATDDISILHQVDRSTEIGAIDLRFSPLGNAVLWHTRALALYGAYSDRVNAYITTLEGETFPATTTENAAFFAWSPDGTHLLFSLRDEDAPERTGFYLTLPGKSGTFLTAPEDPDAWFVPSHQPIGLDWATNNVVLTAEDYGGTLIALRLGTE
jgi:dipeptidyl aminopeptidase/acylaminoacyl peptidase